MATDRRADLSVLGSGIDQPGRSAGANPASTETAGEQPSAHRRGYRLGIIMFLVSIIVAGFLFPRRRRSLKRSKFSRRLNPTRGEEFVDQAGATIRAVSRGVIGISVLQALLAGIGLMVAAFLKQLDYIRCPGAWDHSDRSVDCHNSCHYLSWTFMDTKSALLLRHTWCPSIYWTICSGLS